MSVDEAFKPPVSNDELAYRSISKAAILSVVFAVLGVLVFIGSAFIILNVLATCFGIAGLSAVSKYPNELIGKKAATIGLWLGAIGLVGGIATHTYVYYTEVPDGYTRISFSDLKPNKRTQLHYSEKADLFDGKKVFVRGYVRPSDRKHKLKKFILVGDWGQCCFGGDPKPTDVIGISIKSDDTVNYGLGVRKIGGVFRLHRTFTRTDDKEVPHIIYQIEADYVR